MKIAAQSADERKAATYRIYLQLHAARHVYPPKTLRTVMSELMYAEPCAWRVVGITQGALAAYRDAGKTKIQGIERAYLTDRFKMIRYVLDRDEPMSSEELFQYWRETDQVVIALKTENRGNALGSWVPFENPEGRYFARLGIGFQYRHAVEGDLLRSLAQAPDERGAIEPSQTPPPGP